MLRGWLKPAVAISRFFAAGSGALPQTKVLSGGAEPLLAPLLLVGSWQDTNTHDQQVVTTVAGKQNYGDIQTVLAKWQQAPDSPLRFVDGTWEFLSPLDAWEFLYASLTPTQLNAFESAGRRSGSERMIRP